MLLREMLAAIKPLEVTGPLPAARLTGLTADSRQVRPGMLFAAISGQTHDGHGFLEAARQAGAVAALVERPGPAPEGMCLLQVPDSRRALARAAHEFYGRPSQDMLVAGITGTNGKTTVSYLLESILATIKPAGVMGTVETRYPGYKRASSLTTPDAVEVQEFLSCLKSRGIAQAVMEVSSHALEQGRVERVLYDLAIFTNLSRDHLDYHLNLDNYYLAKRRLFLELLPVAAAYNKSPQAVINLDNPYGERLAGECRQAGLKTWTYGLSALAMVRAEEINSTLEGLSFRLLSPWGDFWITSSLVGQFNLENILAAATAGLALGLAPDQVALGLMALSGVPGRLERVKAGAGCPAVLVDYAHTDDALAKALQVLRPLTPGRLICVFGAGGDRDKGKRPLMGQAVGAYADLAWLTSDNPRTEDPLAIMDMVEQGLLAAGCRACGNGRGYVRQADRAQAIGQAIAAAGPDDVVLIAGKGHEDYQIIGRDRRRFDDREVARQALSREGGHD